MWMIITTVHGTNSIKLIDFVPTQMNIREVAMCTLRTTLGSRSRPFHAVYIPTYCAVPSHM